MQEEAISNPRGRQRAFTLSEVTMSIGVVSAVLLPVLGLLATGTQLAVTSQDHASAASIVDHVTGGLRYEGTTNSDPIISLDAYAEQPLDTSGTTSVFAAFSAEGEFLTSVEEGEFRAGLRGNSDALYLAAITAEPESQPQGGVVRLHPLLRLTIEVHTPAFAAESDRSITRFHSRIGAP